ncbi:CrcB family protein [Nocardioides sp. TF02-7]|uniref:fluoride efflux transporter FluC n=1 Tax=Nocardioides sp. TF02-7 TaxID=2917724 RepID=UPI001F064B60|nr:CrcB family protein [Nocardioides sp. TF02-7]UMG91060.1 CrcB family protein [Nocardioides sp. TF02-7]
MTLLWVAVGAALGAPLRFHLGTRLDGRLPMGTLTANLVGSLLLGAAAGASLDGAAWALVATGFCGGLTTYSAFAVQSRDLGARRGTAYAVVTIGLGLLACAAGFALVQA